jgi:hypothetical protein
MRRHIVIISEDEYEELLSGSRNYICKFFKRKPEFLSLISAGDTVFLRNPKSDILGQFEIGKIICIENPAPEDYEIIKKAESGIGGDEFEDIAMSNQVIITLKIDKLEQLITSPIELDKRSKKEWSVLD